MTGLDQESILTINRAAWDQVAITSGGTALPHYGPLAPTEQTLRLLDPIPGSRVLEVACGSGHSLDYLAERGAAELWGLDFSAVQLALAADLLRPYAPQLRLVESAMEINPGLPANHFDLVLSVYGLGWTADLPGTLALIASYLKPGGCLIFSWEHPAFSCLRYEDQHFVFAEPYGAEGPVLHESWRGVRVVQHKRTLSTFINAVIQTGLQIERLVEGAADPALVREIDGDPARWYSLPRAQLMPTTFIVKARKPLANQQ